MILAHAAVSLHGGIKAAPGSSFVDFYTLMNCEQIEGRLQHYSVIG
jgi:hypothetical protein